MLGFDLYPPRKMATRNRTVNYRELDSDPDDDVIYVGQRSVSRSQRVVPIPTLPKIILGGEEYLVEPTVVNEKHAAEVVVNEQHATPVTVENSGCALFQTLPYEVCIPSLSTEDPSGPQPSHSFGPRPCYTLFLDE